ncbi:MULTISPECIES: DUF5689 domain-containing protein [Flavobacteriaceae]|uniref:Lamin tail domain-containing protein n=2 Tax=Flavobacteriaceae TaxID=49546 RepID=A0A4Y8ASJ0_9FLAO|nr:MULTISPECIES: DUF5689 domain-containing protein [Flavobacteriaceae]TEW73789.1 lamin tail domain-containing protein [Gramella jeungdoensis]GGK37579.1 hypothetical protein GCM10007963_02120 [Lutibacter litoralis]
MKILKKLKFSAFMLLVTSLYLGCVKDDGFSTPKVDCVEIDITSTNTIAQIKDMYTFGGATKIETDVIIEGYVVSNDKSGNIYKSLSIQDKPENPTAAIKIAIDQSDIYTTYNVGRKVYVKLKGLAVGYSFGSIQIGKAAATELGRIPALEVKNHIIRSCEVVEITPKVVTINELNENMLEMLIQIDNVQFKTSELGNAYGNIKNSTTENRILESFNSNCNLTGEVLLRNSGYSDFKNQLLPEGKGSVIAIFSNYYEDFQLYIRGVEDVKFTEARCDYSQVVTPNSSILEITEMYNNSLVEFGVENNYVVEGYVVSSDESGNFKNRLIIQDAIENPAAGIQLLIDKDLIFEEYNRGDKVFVILNKLYMNKMDEVLTIGYPKGSGIAKIETSKVGSFIFNSGENFTITPTKISIAEVKNSEFKNTLVTVTDVQLTSSELGKAFAFFTGDNDGIRTLESCNEPIKLGVFTSGEATFANEKFPEGSGNITGVLSSNLEIRQLEDVVFADAYKECPIIIPKIMITEVADPKNSVSSRFVELYNAGETEIDLSGWRLNKYVNGATTASSSSVVFSGIIIPVGGFIIVANTGFVDMFSITPNIESTYISGNGDDVYELVDNSGNRIDIFGVIGEDGNGTNWEYLDGQAIRNLDINEPNKIFTISEWKCYSDANNNLITNPNTPKNAPNGFSPNLR